MIKTLYGFVSDRIKAQAPQIRFIDLQDDQLQQEPPPLSFPCALIDVDEILFNHSGDNGQLADISFTVQFIFNRIERTNNLTPLSVKDKAWDHLTILKKAVNGLHGYEPDGFEAFFKTQMVRQQNTAYHVYLFTFQTRYMNTTF